MKDKIEIFYLFYLSTGYKLFLGYSVNINSLYIHSKYNYNTRKKFFSKKEILEITKRFFFNNSRNFTVNYAKHKYKKLTIKT